MLSGGCVPLYRGEHRFLLHSASAECSRHGREREKRLVKYDKSPRFPARSVCEWPNRPRDGTGPLCQCVEGKFNAGRSLVAHPEVLSLASSTDRGRSLRTVQSRQPDPRESVFGQLFADALV